MSLTVWNKRPLYRGPPEEGIEACARNCSGNGNSRKIPSTLSERPVSFMILERLQCLPRYWANQTKLTDIEFSLIKVHSQSGYEILKDAELPYPVAQIALQHHERLDCSGYPQGLKGDQILVETKIISVADVVEAMALTAPTDRPKALTLRWRRLRRIRESFMMRK